MAAGFASERRRVNSGRNGERHMRWSSFGALTVVVLPLLGWVGSWRAAAQMESREAISLQDQILELRHELEALQAQQGGGAAPTPYYPQPAYPAPSGGGSSDTVAQLLTRVGALEDQMRELRGRVDELQNTVQRMGADLGKQIDDLKFQLQNPQAAGAAAAGPSHSPTVQSPQPTPLGTGSGTAPPPPPPSASQAPAPPPGPRTPEVALQEGWAAFARHDYVAAQQDAQEVLSKRASPRAYDAQYLLAQSLAGQHQWSRAAIAYDDTYNRSPKGGHAVDALLGLANSLTAISEKRAACDTLTKLHNEFPHPRAELHGQISAAYQRAGCRA
jgi:TolA-binding protein